MDATNSNFSSFAGAGRDLSLAEGHSPEEGGRAIAPPRGAETVSSCATDQPGPTEKTSALFSSAIGGPTLPLDQQKAEQHPASPSHNEQDGDDPLPRSGKRVFSEASQANSPPTKRQKTDKTPWRILPQMGLECIFQCLGMQDKIAFSGVCSSFRRASQACCQQRCAELLASDAPHHRFGRFGIDCPGAATPAHLKAMIARVDFIMELTIAVLQLSDCKEVVNAEEMVLRAPPAELQAVLEVAYHCNLYSLFRRVAPLPPTSTLREATEMIQAWLHSEEARDIQELDVYQFSLTCLSSEIGQLVNLRELKLTSNPLKSLPIELGNLVKLESLNLCSNYFESLPTSFGQLVNLQDLDLSNNRLKTLPTSFGQLVNLRELNLSNNQLKTLPASFGQLASLRDLDLGNNHFESLPSSFGQLVTLLTLKLNYNQLATVPSEMGQLVSLQRLDLSCNRFGTLPIAVGQLVGLRELILGRNPLTIVLPELRKLVHCMVHVF